MSAQQIVGICESKWEANKDDCSGFVRAVASPLGILLTGLANDIFDEVQDSGWTALNDGIDAKAHADAGEFVIGALSGGLNVPAQEHGHVVVVVAGPLDANHHRYPTAYWGRLGGVGKKATTVNFAWNAASRDRVIYAARAPTAITRRALSVRVDGLAVPTAAAFLRDGQAIAWIRPIAVALGAELENFTGNSIDFVLGEGSKTFNVDLERGKSFFNVADLREFPSLEVAFDTDSLTLSILTR